MDMRVKIKPFGVPNFVLLQIRDGDRNDGFTSSPSISIADVPVETLEELCAEFRREVFKKAGKELK
jgi:hypothetical protein